MDNLAFIYENTFIYWDSILTVLAAVTAIGIFVCLYLIKSRNGLGAACMVPLALIASVAAARLVHWYCNQSAYDSLEAAFTNLAGGGYALAGVFAGCLFVAAFLRLLFIVRNLPELLDCLSLAGMTGIAVYSLTLPHTGALPIPFLAASAVFAAGLLLFILGKSCKFLKDGETALLVLCAYGITGLVLPGIGFAGFSRLFGLGMPAITILYFCIRLVVFLTRHPAAKAAAARSNTAKDSE